MHRKLTHLKRSNLTQVSERHMTVTETVARSCHSSELEGCTKKGENWQNKQQDTTLSPPSPFFFKAIRECVYTNLRKESSAYEAGTSIHTQPLEFNQEDT